jgi:hypothetical protein
VLLLLMLLMLVGCSKGKKAWDVFRRPQLFLPVWPVSAFAGQELGFLSEGALPSGPPSSSSLLGASAGRPREAVLASLQLLHART